MNKSITSKAPDEKSANAAAVSGASSRRANASRNNKDRKSGSHSVQNPPDIESGTMKGRLETAPRRMNPPDPSRDGAEPTVRNDQVAHLNSHRPHNKTRYKKSDRKHKSSRSHIETAPGRMNPQEPSRCGAQPALRNDQVAHLNPSHRPHNKTRHRKSDRKHRASRSLPSSTATLNQIMVAANASPPDEMVVDDGAPEDDEMIDDDGAQEGEHERNGGAAPAPMNRPGAVAVAGIDNDGPDEERTVTPKCLISNRLERAAESGAIVDNGVNDSTPPVTEPRSQERKRHWKWIAATLAALIIVVVAVVLGVVLTRGDTQDPVTVDPYVLDELVTMLSNISSTTAEALQDPTSNQYMAVEWLANTVVENGFDLSADEDRVTVVNRFVLAYLFFAWQGIGWTRSEGWLSSQSECDWYGITCEGQDIVGIELGYNALESGPGDGLPEEVFVFTSLEILNISGGFLSGTIPSDIVELDKLVTLDIGGLHPRFGQYPVDLFRIPNLRHLSLSYDTVDGSLPTEIGLAVNLESFFADNAQLTNTVPSEIGKLTNLDALSLYENALTGTLPTEIGLLKSLKYFVVSGNNHEGSIPSELGSLSSLEALEMGANFLTGTIPTEVAGLPNLRFFPLYHNRLTGTVPVELLSSGNLECFDASDNFIANSIPQGVCPASTPDDFLVVVCDEEDSEACSCCICEPLTSVDICRVHFF